MSIKKITKISYLCLFFLIGALLFHENVFAVDDFADKNAQIIVKYDKDSKFVELNLEGIKARKNLTNTMEVIELEGSDKVSDAIESLKENTDVEYAQPNYILSAKAIEDEYYYYQWGAKNQTTEGIDINAELAWEITQGLDSVVVGVLDTGIDINHEDLMPNLYININEIPGNNLDDDHNGYIDDINGYNFFDDSPRIYSDLVSDKHGTAIAGIIAARENTIGIKGVASHAKILPLKFMDGQEGYTSDAILAIEYAKKLGIKIINCIY